LAGQTVTVSFWAKGTNPTTAGSLNVTVIQSFGDGGSPSSLVIQNFGSFVLTANWTRYSLTATVPSIAGKTIGTVGNDNLSFGFGQGANTSTDAWTLDLWGVQVEAGSTASPFQTATGTIQGELAACQRYYYRETATSSAFTWFGNTGFASSGTNIFVPFRPPVTMRIPASALDYSNLALSDGATNLTVTSASLDSNFTNSTQAVNFVVSSASQFRPYSIRANNSTSAYLGFNAEL